MALILDWTLQKFYYYVLHAAWFSGILALLVYFEYIMASIYEGGHEGISLSWFIPLMSIASAIMLFFLMVSVGWLIAFNGNMVKNDARAMSIVWLWQVLARSTNERYLNFVNGHERRLEIYRHLASNHAEIRLVTIMPGEGSDPIKCTFDHTILGTNAPAYEALSYTWGSSHSVGSITLNNTPFHVTKNLKAALRDLRLPHTTRIVWIDAICINQADNDERGEQVQLMREIYAQAKEVIVWLGQESDSSNLAMDFFESASTNPDIEQWFKDTITKTGQGLYKNEWEAVFALLEREYWKRTWIIQELACAAKITLLCGVRSVSWDVLIISLSAWYDLEQSQCSDSIKASMASIRAGTKTGGSWGRKIGDLNPLQFESNRNALRNSSESQSLVNLMCKHWKSRLTDERDMIYAFAGIASDCQHPALPIDYSIPTWTVYLQTLAFLLEKTGSLDMITYSGIGNQPIGRPTWAPSFYWADRVGRAFESSQQMFNSTGRCPFTASKDAQARALFLGCHRRFDKFLGIDRTILQVEGCCIDIISRQLLYKDEDSWIMGKGMEAWKLGLARKTRRKYLNLTSSSAWMQPGRRRGELEIIELLYYFVLETPSPSPVVPGANATPEERTEELWRTLIYDRTSGGLIAPEEWSQAFSVLINGPSSVPTNFEPQSSMSSYSDLDRARSFTRPFLDAAENLFSGNFWLFLTKTGRLGVANKNAKVGDLVCVLPGCSMPVIIRQSKSQRQNNILNGTMHGSAYLHYYMYGKAIEDLNTGSLSLRTFKLK
jgi:hypothetical protein